MTFRAPRGPMVRILAVTLSIAALGAVGCGDGEEDDDDDNEGAGAVGGTATSCAGSAGSSNATGGSGGTGGTGGGGGDGEPIVPLKEAKLIIEHNATDADTGFQGFLDGEGWTRLDMSGPRGTVLTFEGKGELAELGLTELFFETVEPENADVPLEDMLAKLPEGEYTFEGPTVDGGRTAGTATLSHKIPAGPELLEPEEGASVPPEDLVVSWSPVTEAIDGSSVTIVAYQLIVEKDEEPAGHWIGKRSMSLYLDPSVTSVSIPNQFLEPGTPYLWEVLAIEESGNQTLSSSEFSTE